MRSSGKRESKRFDCILGYGCVFTSYLPAAGWSVMARRPNLKDCSLSLSFTAYVHTFEIRYVVYCPRA
ncbi:MAG: hypothetical protein ACXV5P_09775, partial [Halobacteriota archaeon]